MGELHYFYQSNPICSVAMAKQTSRDTASRAREIEQEIRSGRFRPIYLLMGEEPYYIDRISSLISATAVEESARDFNQIVLYGNDTTVSGIIEAASQYPMMSERLLVTVREAQAVRRLEDLARYAASPMDSTVLVICHPGKSVDKRTAFYKAVLSNGAVLESVPPRDYELPAWIQAYCREQGLDITPDAASLLAEYAGTDLSKIALETDKIRKSIDGKRTGITVSDIEANVGITRQFSIFELTKALSYRRQDQAMRIAAYVGREPRFAMPAAVSALFLHFFRILKYHSLKQKGGFSASDAAKELGVNPYFLQEYDRALSEYPLPSCMKAISLLKDYDFKGKGGECGEATQGELLMELVSKILSI